MLSFTSTSFSPPSPSAAAAAASSSPSTLRLRHFSCGHHPRRNHLRSKLLHPPFLQTRQPLSDEALLLLLLFHRPPHPQPPAVAEEEQENEKEKEEVSGALVALSHPVPLAKESSLPRKLPLYLGLFVAQILFSFLFCRQWISRKDGNTEVVEEELPGEQWGDLEGEVEQIRAMAKDARDIDARRAENGKLKERYGEIRMGAQMAAERSMRRMAKEWSDALLAKKKTGNGTGTGSVSVRKKLDFRWIRAALGADGARSPPKGFGRAKSVEDVRSSPEDHDAVQKITKDVVDQATMQTVNRHSTTGDSALSVDSTILTSKTSTTSEHDPQGCSNEEKQRVINDGGASGSGPNLLDFIAGATLPNSSLSKKDSKMDDFTMHSGNAMEETSIKDGHSGSRLLRSHSSLKKILQSNVSPAKGFTSSRPSKIQKQIKRDRTHGSNQKSDNGCWWLKLPYLLVICLHGKSNGRSYEGLYILKMDPQSNATLSYIVAFEDRGDAINFCCILRPFFKGLDLSADIVPMTGKELKEGVKSAKLNVIAVRKGQLHMYAGKSLLEVENSLRSILDECVSKKD